MAIIKDIREKKESELKKYLKIAPKSIKENEFLYEYVSGHLKAVQAISFDVFGNKYETEHVMYISNLCLQFLDYWSSSPSSENNSEEEFEENKETE